MSVLLDDSGLRIAFRGTALVLPAALTVACFIAVRPLFTLPAWSTRAPLAVAEVLGTTAALVLIAWIVVALGLGARTRFGRLAPPAAAAAAVALLLAAPAGSVQGAEVDQVAGRLVGGGLLVLAAAFPVLRVRLALRLGLAASAAASAAGLFLSPTVRPDIVLVTVDTLRADRINAREFADLAPNVQRFAGEAVRFTHVWSVAPWTIPAMSSIFTGIHPSAHGARFCNDAAESLPISRWWFIHGAPNEPHPIHTIMTRGVETLPEALSRGGYATGGFSDWFLVSPRTGFARGFDRFSLAPSTTTTT